MANYITNDLTDAYDSLEDSNAIPFSEDDENSPFTVTDDSKAEWLIKKLREQEKETQDFIDFYKEQIRKVQNSLDNFRSFAEMKLYQYLMSGLVPVRTTKTETKYSLPSGTIKLKKQAPAFSYDKDVLIGELQAKHIDGFIEQKPDLQWAKLKKNLVIMDDNTIALSDTGEIIDNIVVSSQPDKVIITLNKENA